MQARSFGEWGGADSGSRARPSSTIGQGTRLGDTADFTRPASNSSAYAPAWGSSVQELEAKTERHKAAIEASQQRMLRLAQSAEQTGAATLAELHSQREALHRIRKDQDHIDANLQSADWLLRGMESWGGALKNAWSSWWEADAANSQPAEEKARTNHEPVATSACSAAPAAPACAPHVRTNDGAPAQQDSADAMKQLSQLVTGLKVQAEQMHSEIASQSSVLDSALETADKHGQRVRANAERTTALSKGSWF